MTAVDPRFSRPKVMLVDTDSEATQQVRAAGYTVVEGSLGRPLKVPAQAGYIPVSPNPSLRGFAEQEVVVVQQVAREPVDITPQDQPTVTDKTNIWGSTAEGVIDVRPWAAVAWADDARRILRHGGVFICFCASPRPSGLVEALPPTGYGGNLYVKNELPWTVWDLVPELRQLHVEHDYGTEITPVPIDLLDALAPHLVSATFDCTVDAPSHVSKNWVELARNKYGKSVAGIFVVEGETSGDKDPDHGWVFLLPQVKDKGACVVALLDHVLPVLARKLFPESDNTTWLHEETYELPAVVELNAEIAESRRQAEAREAELRAKVERQREQDDWMHTLLTGTDDELVDAVKLALDDLGLQDVRKVDDEKEQKTTGRRREDIQVWGQSPVMLVEVKGLTNLPKESNSLQVFKYFIPRMRQWNRQDVRGLSVINHQRGLPALLRENVHTFQQDVLDNADELGFGLITTVDLFRLVRNKRRWEWPGDTVAQLLYENGRILPIPTHYEHVGTVDGFFEKASAVTISVTASGFAVGDQLAFILPVDYAQQFVGSIHLDDAEVQQANVGDRVGIKTALTKGQARNGVAVYRVNAAS